MNSTLRINGLRNEKYDFLFQCEQKGKKEVVMLLATSLSLFFFNTLYVQYLSDALYTCCCAINSDHNTHYLKERHLCSPEKNEK